MRKTMVSFVLAVASLAAAPAALADGWYLGAKAGKMMIDQSGGSDPTNAGLLLGYEIGLLAGDLGFEGEITRTIDEGEFFGNDVKVETEALYAAFRTAGPAYLIAKAGYLHEKVKIGGASDSDSGTSLGLGVGFSAGLLALEIEYTVIEDDINFLSLGVRF